MIIERGQKYFIKPNEFITGIPQGLVKIVRVVDFEEVCDEYIDPVFMVNENSDLKDSKWVVFRYIDRPGVVANCIDIASFIDLV